MIVILQRTAQEIPASVLLISIKWMDIHVITDRVFALEEDVKPGTGNVNISGVKK